MRAVFEHWKESMRAYTNYWDKNATLLHDLIFCMEKSHLNRLRRKFPEALQGKRVICLHIPDEFEFMQMELIDDLRAKLAPYVTLY